MADETQGAADAATGTEADGNVPTVVEDGTEKKGQDKAAQLLDALNRERAERKRLKAELESTTKTDAERLVALERKLADITMKATAEKAFSEAIAGLPEGFKVDIAAARELWGCVSFVDEEDALGLARKIVESLKRPDVAPAAMKAKEADAEKPAVTTSARAFDPMKAADWLRAYKEDPEAFEKMTRGEKP